MRLMVFFDLPTDTADDRRNYRHFRKGLIKNGFMMVQQSVYCRMVLNQTVELSVIEKIKLIKPPKGMVIVLTITEKQFANMQFICGDFKSEVVDSDKRVVII